MRRQTTNKHYAANHTLISGFFCAYQNRYVLCATSYDHTLNELFYIFLYFSYLIVGFSYLNYKQYKTSILVVSFNIHQLA